MPTSPPIPPLGPNATYDEIVRHYVLHRRERLHGELKHFSEQPSFDLALHEAVLARDGRQKRLSHQRRLPTHVIPRSLPLMQAAIRPLRSAKSFDDLFLQVEAILQQVPRAGDLYKYDTSLRLGAFLGLYPTRVFLQTGAYDGARKISREYKDRSVPLANFPAPFHALAPFEMENLLCSYKADLRPKNEI